MVDKLWHMVLISWAFGCVVYPVAAILISLACLPNKWALASLSLFAFLAALPIPKRRPQFVTRLVAASVAACSDWLDLKVIYNHDKFTRKGPYIIGLEPHSVIPVAMPALMNSVTTQLPPACMPCHGLATSVGFYMPVAKHWWWWLDLRPVSRAWMKRLICEGASQCLTPGGVQECLHMAPEKEVAFLRNRRGFVRIALEHGTPLVPAFAFGQTQLFHYLRPGPPFVSKGALAWVSRRLGFVPMLLWGWWFTTVPLQKPMSVVLGDPIIVPKIQDPSRDQCQLYLDKFIAEMQQLVEKHKAEQGHPDLELTVM